jgi:hypothetical protein
MEQCVTIEITRDDIRQGLRHSAESCPVALALSRSRPDVAWTVRPTYAFDQQKGQALYFDIDLIHWIARFDAGGRRAVRPKAFVVDAPEST